MSVKDRTITGAVLIALLAGCSSRHGPRGPILPPNIDTHVAVFLRLDPAGKCVSLTQPQIVNVYQNATVIWDVVNVSSPGGSCPSGTKLELLVPDGVLGSFEPDPRDPGQTASTGTGPTAARSTAKAPDDKQWQERYTQSGDDATTRGRTFTSPPFSFQGKAKAVGKPGSYKYAVRVVGGRVEDPKLDIWPPP